MDYSDVELVSGGQAFPCHRFMLSARSDVFRAMFTNNMREANERKVQVEDAGPTAVGQLLK